MSPDVDGGRSQLGVTLPNELKTAVYETAHERRKTMSDITRESIRLWFMEQNPDDLPDEAVENLETLPTIDSGRLLEKNNVEGDDTEIDGGVAEA